jgi:hypothetical protein
VAIKKIVASAGSKDLVVQSIAINITATDIEEQEYA